MEERNIDDLFIDDINVTLISIPEERKANSPLSHRNNHSNLIARGSLGIMEIVKTPSFKDCRDPFKISKGQMLGSHRSIKHVDEPRHPSTPSSGNEGGSRRVANIMEDISVD